MIIITSINGNKVLFGMHVVNKFGVYCDQQVT